jgi:hypothetical protein
MSAAILLGAEEYGAVYNGAQDLLFIDALKLNLKSARANMSSKSAADVKEFTIDTFVTIAGLQGNPELNGKYGKVLSFDEGSGRYTVKINNSAKTVAIKRDNLQAVATFAINTFVTIAGLAARQDLNGKYGKVLSFDEGNGRYTVAINNTAQTVAIQPDNLQAVATFALDTFVTIAGLAARPNSAANVKAFDMDTFVTIAGLKARTNLNGKYGKVLGVNEEDKSRYDVEIKIEGLARETVAIKTDNLQAAKLNGKYVNVLWFDVAKGLYTVVIQIDNSSEKVELAIKPDNLQAGEASERLTDADKEFTKWNQAWTDEPLGPEAEAIRLAKKNASDAAAKWFKAELAAAEKPDLELAAADAKPPACRTAFDEAVEAVRSLETAKMILASRFWRA